MTREHTPRPGITWATTTVRVETVVPDDTPEPYPLRPNRAARRAVARRARKARR